MIVDIRQERVKDGVLVLVLTLVEVIRDALKLQALRRMESGVLTDEECERLGESLMEMEMVIEQIKEEQGLTRSVQELRDGLDRVVKDMVDRMTDPELSQS